MAVLNDQVQADYKDGILSLTLPKVAEARNTVVKLNLADTTPAESLPADTQASSEAADG